MRTIIPRVRSAAFAGLLLALVVHASALAEPSTAAISGVVSGNDGVGLPGVLVTADGPVSRTVTSSEHGLFTINDLPAGDYALNAVLDGFTGQGLASVMVTGGRRHVVRLVLEPLAFGDAIRVVSAVPRDGLAATEMRESPGREAAEALTRLAGMSRVRRAAVASDVVLRGYQGENVNVLVDGVKVYGACPNNMDPPAFHTDLSEVERVEVGKGPFDVKNGGSLGGVVNLVTRRPAPGLALVPSLTLGSFGYVNPTLTASYGGDRVSLQAGLSNRKGKPYADGNGRRFTTGAGYLPTAVDSDAFRVDAGWLRFGWQPGNGQRVQLAYARQEADHVLYPYLQMDAIYDNTDRLNLSWERELSASVVKAVRVQGYATRVGHFMTDQFRTSGAGKPRPYSMATDTNTRSAGAKLEVELGTVRTGVEAVRRTWLAETTMAGSGYAVQSAIPDVTADAVGAYAEAGWELAPRLSIEAGARYDWARAAADESRANTNLYYAYKDTRETSASDAYPSGKLRFVYAAGGGLELSAGVGRAVRVPDPQERFFALRRMGSDWVGNPRLGPTRNTGFDLGAKLALGSVRLDLTAFHDRLDDFIVVHDQVRLHVVPGVMNPVARSWAATDVTMRGFEVSATANLSEALSLNLDAAAVRGTQTPRPDAGITSRNLAEVPPENGRLAIRYHRSAWFAEAEGVFAARQDRVNADLLEQPSAGYSVANLRAGNRYRWLQLTAAVYNLLDRQYREHLSYQRDPFRSGFRVPEPGRSVAVTASASF